MEKRFYKDTEIEIFEGDIVYFYNDGLKGNHEYCISSFNIGTYNGTCSLISTDFTNGIRGVKYVSYDELTFNRRKHTHKERYIGYGKQLDLPSGRVGIELKINNLKMLIDEMESKGETTVLVLPVKPENVTTWRTHSVKISENKYK